MERLEANNCNSLKFGECESKAVLRKQYFGSCYSGYQQPSRIIKQMI